MSNPFLDRAKQFGLQDVPAGRARQISVDLPPPPPGYNASAVFAASTSKAPGLATVGENKSTLTNSPATTTQVQPPLPQPPGVQQQSFSPNFNPPPGSSGPPPAGGAAKKYEVGNLPPPPSAATATVATKTNPTPVVAPVVAKTFTPTSAPAATTSVPLPQPPSVGSNPPLPSPPPPSSDGLKTTLYPQSNVVGGVERGVFGELYGNKTTGGANNIAAAASVVSSSKVAALGLALGSLSSAQVPPPPVAEPAQVPPPPPPSAAEDTTPPPPPPPAQTPLQEELSTKLAQGLSLKPVPPPSQQQQAHPPLPVPPPASSPTPSPTAFSSAPTVPSRVDPFVAAPPPPPPSSGGSGSQFCRSCSKLIVGAVLEVGDGENYHPECFVCSRCNQPLKEDIMLVGSKPCHPGCINCATCGLNVASSPFAVHPKTGGIFCATHAKAGLAANPNEQPPPPPPSSSSSANAAVSPTSCRGCGQTTVGSTEPLIQASEGRIYHARCVKCASCQTVLSAAGGSVYSHEGNFYCERDYLLRIAPKCDRCSQPISGEAIAIGAAGGGKKSFHSACFNCAGCKKSLDGAGFYMNDQQQVVCEKCA